MGLSHLLEARFGVGFRWVEEVAEEGRRAGEDTGGNAAPAVASDGGAEEIDVGEATEDVAEDVPGEDVDVDCRHHRLLRLQRQWWWWRQNRGWRASGRGSFGFGFGLASLLHGLPRHRRRAVVVVEDKGGGLGVEDKGSGEHLLERDVKCRTDKGLCFAFCMLGRLALKE